MKQFKLKLISLLLAISVTLYAHNDQKKLDKLTQKKAIENQWINGLLLGKDLSHVSQAYASHIKNLQANGTNANINQRNNYLENFKNKYNKFTNDVATLAKMDTNQNNWKNKVIYLKQSYRLAKKAQRQLLQHLKKQQQFLLNKDAPKAKLQLIERLIQTTHKKLTPEINELLGNEGVNKFTKLSHWQNFINSQNNKKTTENNKSQTIIRPRNILRNSSLPYSGRKYSAPTLNYLPDITPSYANSVAAEGLAEDLSEDLIVQFSPAINQLASDLNHDYLSIINFVRQNVKLQYYPGAQKGADATLRSLAGNDIDQAALLIALLRRSNIPSRFVQGVIRQPIEKVMASIGLTNPNQVLQALNKAGIAHEPVIEGGQVTAIQSQYTWVSAYIPYANYRGSVADLSNKTWLPLAPAIKQDNIIVNDYNYQNANIDADTFVLDYLTDSVNQSPLLFWKTRVQNDVTNNYPNLSYQSLINRLEHNTQAYQLIPASLPFEVIVTTYESHQLPVEQIQSLTIQMGGNSQYLDVTLLMPQVAGKRLSLSYAPATVDDLNIINQAGGMALVQPFLVDLRPIIKLDGKQVNASNAPLPMASFSDLKVTFNSPAGNESFNRNTLIGNYLTLTITTQSDNYPLDDTTPNLFADETQSIRLMHNLAKLYNLQWKQAEAEIADVMDVALIKPIPALTIISPEYNLLQSQGLVTQMQFKGMSIDAVTNSVDAISRTYNPQIQYDFYRISALQGSYLESNIAVTQMALDAVSADQGIRRLADNHSILHLTPLNYQTQLAATNHPQYIKDQISSWLQIGYHAILVATTDTIDTWNGSSWVIYDPDTGHSGYFISGLYAGCQTTLDPSEWVNTELYNLLINPYSEGANTDPLSARSVAKLEFTDNQLGIVNQKLASPLAVIVLDEFNNPVSGAQVEFEIRNGTGELSTLIDPISSSFDKVETFSDGNGIASVDLRFLEEISGGARVLLNPGDEHLSQLGVTQVSIAVTTNLGKIYSDSMFFAFAKADDPVSIDVTSICTNDRSQECLTQTGDAGAKGNVFHYRVVDQYGNFVSNVPIDINTEPELTGPDQQENWDPSLEDGLGPFPHYSRGKIAMKYDNCHEFSIFPLNCAQEQIHSLSDYYWTSFIPFHPHIANDSEVYEFNIILSNPEMPNHPNLALLPENIITYNVRDGNLSGNLRYYLTFASNYQGPYGSYEAGKSGIEFNTERKYLVSNSLQNNQGYSHEGLFNINHFLIFVNGGTGISQGLYVNDDQFQRLIRGSFVATDRWTMLVETKGTDHNVFNITGEPAKYEFEMPIVKCDSVGGNSTTLTFFDLDACTGPLDLGREQVIIRDNVIIADINITDISLLYTDNLADSIKSPVAIKFEILPANFKPENIVVNIYKGNELFSSTKSEYPASSNGEQLFNPLDDRLNGIYQAEIIINQGNPYEITSQRVPINAFSDKVVESIKCNNTDSSFTDSACGGKIINNKIPSQLNLLTSIDLSDPLVCKDEGIEVYLNTEADITIELTELDAFGIVPPTPVKTTIAQGVFPAGANIIPLSADELGNGLFKISINAVSIANGNSEFITGMVNSKYEIKDSLLVGHSVVKGVDLADGAMVYSKKDIALPSAGSDLEFIRTYSNKNRYQLGPLGFGWSHNYMSRVIQSNCGRIYVTGADGGTARFRTINDEIVPMKGFHSTLISNADGSYSFYSKNGTHYHYLKRQDRVWWMDFIEDTNGNRLSIDVERRNGAPIINSVTDAVGRTLTYNYELKTINNRTGQLLTRVIGPQDIEINFTYNNKGQLISAKREGDTTDESYSYSNQISGYNINLLQQVTDNTTGANRVYEYIDKIIHIPANIAVVNNIKDKQINSITETDGGTTTFNYSNTNQSGSVDFGFNDTIIINQNNTITTYTLNDYGAATEISAPNGTKHMEWQIADEILLLSETDENGRVKNFEYDENANLTKESIGDIYREYTYVPAQTTPPYIKDRIESYSNWRNKTTTYSYDSQGNKLTETLAGNTIHYAYTSQGLVQNITDARGQIQLFTYDNYGNLDSQTDALGNKTSMLWDQRGRKIQETDANGNITKFLYDNSDRITTKSVLGDDLGARIWQYFYQLGGLIKVEIDPKNNFTTYTYDKMGRLLNINNANDNNFSYSYDLNGNKLTENDFKGNQTTFIYNTSNRLTTKTEPEGKVTSYTYDNVGNVLTESTADRVATYGYDPKRYFLTSFTGEAPASGGSKGAAISATTTRTVDGEGNILTEIDPNGNLTTFAYDDFNRLLTESGPMGSGRTLSYDANGNILSEITYNITGNQTRSYSYDAANRKVTSIGAEGSITSFSYDANGNVITETRPLGKITSYEYNNLNLVTKKTENGEPDNAQWLYTYDLTGNLTTETWPNANIITTTYDLLNRPISKTDSLGALNSFSYDENSNIVSETDGNGNSTSYQYNGLNQRTTASKPLNRSHTYTYTPFGEMLSDTGPNGTITYSVNTLGQRESATGPNGYSEYYVYDLNDNLTSFTDSRGTQTLYSINALNQTTSQSTDAFSKTFGYDTVGNKLTETDYRGITSTYTYDKENRQTHFSRAGQQQKATLYNEAGLATRETDANGNAKVHQYSSQYYRTQTNLPETQLIKYTNNAFGDVTFQDNPGRNDITRVFDKRRRLKSETNGAGEQTQYQYDLNNNRTAVIKPDGTRWEYAYDAANRLTSITNTVEHITTTYAYDTKDNLISITDAEGKTTTFDYDNRNRKLAKHYPDGQSVSYGYDDNGNLKTVSLPNGVGISYDYDVLNRQISKHYSGTQGVINVDFIIDGNGNINQVTENIEGVTSSITASFDDFDRIVSITDHHGNALQYSYDANGNRNILNDIKNTQSNYTFDDLNRLSTAVIVGTGSFDYVYNAAGLMSEIQYPNNGNITFTYDNANRIDVITAKQSGATVATYDYQYDANGNRLAVVQSNINGSETISYAYDKADRLIQVTYPDVTVNYTLDKVGNRLQETIDNGTSVTKTYSYNNRDQLTGIVSSDGMNITYSYDNAGNQTEMNRDGTITTFDYDARQRVKTITKNSLPIHYKYDYLGNRIEKESNGQTTYYTYDGSSLLYETNTIGNVLAKYHYGSDRILAETRNNQNSYIYHDALRTPIAITNADGSIQNRLDYDAFGNLKSQAGTSEFPYGFTGYQKDEDTGLYYAKARYYSPEEGRFIREDPLEGDVNTPPSLHRYLYANANPNSFIDPTGKGNDTSHYYDALLIGSLVGLNEYQSASFALGAQIADEFQQTDAVENSIGFVTTKAFLDSPNQSQASRKFINDNLQSKIVNNCGNHALCGVSPKFLRNTAVNFVLNDAQNLLEVGTADHAFTDSFFHIRKDQVDDLKNQKLLTPIIGHFWEWKDTDKAYLYHDSKRVKAFKARAWLMYNYTLKQGTQTLSRKQFEEDLNKAVFALDNQYNTLIGKHQKLGYVEGGVYTWTTNFDEITDREEFDMVRDMLTGKGFGNIPRTEDNDLARNVNKLLNDYSIEQLRGIIQSNYKVDEQKLNNTSKADLVKFLNARLFAAQTKSRDAIYAGVVREKAKNDTVKENGNAPGIKELSK